MSADLIGVTATGGVPLFARQSIRKSNESNQQTDSLPFATLAALNGVNLFSRLNDADLLSCITKDSIIRWKVYKGSIVLIAIITNLDINEEQLLNFVDVVFDCIVLTCGITEITCQNIERLKRCLKHSYQLIDYLINCLVGSGQHLLSLITSSVEYSLIGEDKDFFYSLVESVAQYASSSFCSLFVNQKLVSASKLWWTKLSCSRDSLVISFLVNSLSQTSPVQTSDMIVFLPENCPSSATRLIVSQLFDGAIICLLCAENPNLEIIENEIICPLKESKIHQEKFFNLVINPKTPNLIGENIISLVVIRDDFQIMSQYGPIEEISFKYILKLIELQNCLSSNRNSFESYISFSKYKCYYILHNQFRIFTILPNNLTTSEMRSLTSKTLNSLIRDKQIWP